MWCKLHTTTPTILFASDNTARSTQRDSENQIVAAAAAAARNSHFDGLNILSMKRRERREGEPRGFIVECIVYSITFLIYRLSVDVEAVSECECGEF